MVILKVMSTWPRFPSSFHRLLSNQTKCAWIHVSYLGALCAQWFTGFLEASVPTSLCLKPNLLPFCCKLTCQIQCLNCFSSTGNKAWIGTVRYWRWRSQLQDYWSYRNVSSEVQKWDWGHSRKQHAKYGRRNVQLIQQDSDM